MRRSEVKVTPSGFEPRPCWLPACVLTAGLHSHPFCPKAMGRGEGKVPL